MTSKAPIVAASASASAAARSNHRPPKPPKQAPASSSFPFRLAACFPTRVWLVDEVSIFIDIERKLRSGTGR